MEHAAQGGLIDRQRRLAGSAPHFLVGVGEEGSLHLGEARPPVGAILVGRLFRPEIVWGGHGVRPSAVALIGECFPRLYPNCASSATLDASAQAGGNSRLSRR